MQPTCTPVDQHLVELLIMIDAFRRSSAARITAVIPYYGYARQDRKDKPRVPITAKLVANLIGAAGANRVLTMDLHKAQIQGFFDIPVDHLFAAPVIIDYLARQRFPNLTIVAPDVGGAERARAYAKRLGAGPRGGRQAAVSGDGSGRGDERDRRRRGSHLHPAGRHRRHRGHDAEGRQSRWQARGPSGCFASAVHGVLSGPALSRIEQSPIEKMIVTNTIPVTGDHARSEKIVVLSVARLLAQAIRSIHEESSVSSLFV